MLKDQTDLLRAFNTARVRYLLIGGYALGRYTEPRVTRDLEVFVDPSAENSYRTFEGLSLVDAPLAGYQPEDFQTVYESFQIGAPRYAIDIISVAFRLKKPGRTASKVLHRKASRSATFPPDTSSGTKPPQAVCKTSRMPRRSRHLEKQMETIK
jgi:hypothetical protein